MHCGAKDLLSMHSDSISECFDPISSSVKWIGIKITCIRSTFFAAALEGSPSRSLIEWDRERGAIVLRGVPVEDFRMIWGYLVYGRAPLIQTFADYDRLLSTADYLCVRGLFDLRKEPRSRRAPGPGFISSPGHRDRVSAPSPFQICKHTCNQK